MASLGEEGGVGRRRKEEEEEEEEERRRESLHQVVVMCDISVCIGAKECGNSASQHE